ncbi:MAG: ribonuclease P protein component [Coleofasciculaceae cyanobacterium]
MTLPQPHRLKQRRDFQAVYHKGIRRTGRYLILRGLPEPSRDPKEANQEQPTINQSKLPTKIGISISQKVSKKAVVRNRIKRQIKAILRQLLPRIAPGWQLVVVVRPGAKECEYAHFLRELEQLLVEAEVLNGY